jgi:hypothetical protein
LRLSFNPAMLSRLKIGVKQLFAPDLQWLDPYSNSRYDSSGLLDPGRAFFWDYFVKRFTK